MDTQHYMNAFLNGDGGTIYFGIADDGKVLGLPLTRKQRDTLRLRIDTIVSGNASESATRSRSASSHRRVGSLQTPGGSLSVTGQLLEGASASLSNS